MKNTKLIFYFKKAFSHERYRKKILFKTIGNFLLLFSFLMLIKIFHKPIYYEVRYFLDKKRGISYEVFLEDESSTTKAIRGGLSKSLRKRKVRVLIPKDENFSIVIPKIAANSNVIPNVNAADEREYLKALKKGVAHANGTAFPGEGGHIFLFAHSTDYIWNVGTYNAVFYLLYKLEAGDEVYLVYKGRKYVYKVIGKKIVNPEEVEYLTRKTNKEFLTLQTCWPPGTTWKRLLVFAEPLEQ